MPHPPSSNPQVRAANSIPRAQAPSAACVSRKRTRARGYRLGVGHICVWTSPTAVRYRTMG
eukprot:4629459-Lingulodinium_polyedra.AAC.1